MKMERHVTENLEITGTT